MDAVPMIARCLELQNPELSIPDDAFQSRGLEPHSFGADVQSEWCARCECNHGAPMYYYDPPDA